MSLKNPQEIGPTHTHLPHPTSSKPSSDLGWTAGLIGRIIILIFTAEIGYMAFTYPTNALVQIGAEFQTNQVAWLQTAYALAASVTAMIIGTLADRFGKRRVILVVLTVALAGLLLAAFAPNFGIMVVGRVLQSTTLALPFLLPGLVRDIFPARTVPLGIALVATGAGLLSIGVSFSAGYVIQAFDFRAVFWVPAVFVAVMAALVHTLVPESTVRAEGRPLDYLGSALFGLGLLGALLGVSLGPVWGWTSLSTVGAIAGGAAFLLLWVIQSLKTRLPLLDLREFKSFPFVVTFLFSLLGTSASIWFFVINTTIALTPNTVGWGLGLEPEAAGIFAALYTLGSFAGGIIVGKLLGKVSAATVGALVMVFQVGGFVIALGGLSNSTLFGLAALLVGVAGGGTYAVVYNLVALLAEPQRQATMGALVTVGANVGGAVLPVVIFAVMNSSMTMNGQTPLYSLGAMQFAMILPAALGAILVILAVALRRSLSTRTELLAGTNH